VKPRKAQEDYAQDLLQSIHEVIEIFRICSPEYVDLMRRSIRTLVDAHEADRITQSNRCSQLLTLKLREVEKATEPLLRRAVSKASDKRQRGPNGSTR
jgi:hypothetical protein